MARPSVRRQIRRPDNGERRKLGEDSSSKNDWRGSFSQVTAPCPKHCCWERNLSQDYQAGPSEPIASRSISDRCQIPEDTFGRRCSGSLPLRIFFLLTAPQQPCAATRGAIRSSSEGARSAQAKAPFNRTNVPIARVRPMEHQPKPGISVSIQRAHFTTCTSRARPSPRSSYPPVVPRLVSRM